MELYQTTDQRDWLQYQWIREKPTSNEERSTFRYKMPSLRLTTQESGKCTFSEPLTLSNAHPIRDTNQEWTYFYQPLRKSNSTHEHFTNILEQKIVQEMKNSDTFFMSFFRMGLSECLSDGISLSEPCLQKIAWTLATRMDYKEYRQWLQTAVVCNKNLDDIVRTLVRYYPKP